MLAKFLYLASDIVSAALAVNWYRPSKCAIFVRIVPSGRSMVQKFPLKFTDALAEVMQIMDIKMKAMSGV